MNAEKKENPNGATEWFGILIGPLAWLTQFLINYALVQLACRQHNNLRLHLISGLFLAIVIFGGVVSAVSFSRSQEYSASGEEFSARRHFMASLGISSAALFAFAIVAQALASFILDPCQK
jgi:hypothetical protein